jgi:hypothetical protein
LGVESQQAASKKAGQGKTKKEEYPFQIALAAVAENHNHPKERKERSGGQVDEPNVRGVVHVSLLREV